jgi:hypothetical protein
MYASGIPQKLAWEPTIYIWVKYTCTWILGAINVKKEQRYSINMQNKIRKPENKGFAVCFGRGTRQSFSYAVCPPGKHTANGVR